MYLTGTPTFNGNMTHYKTALRAIHSGIRAYRRETTQPTSNIREPSNTPAVMSNGGCTHSSHRPPTIHITTANTASVLLDIHSPPSENMFKTIRPTFLHLSDSSPKPGAKLKNSEFGWSCITIASFLIGMHDPHLFCRPFIEGPIEKLQNRIRVSL
jgi:hypothetical protein